MNHEAPDVSEPPPRRWRTCGVAAAAFCITMAVLLIILFDRLRGESLPDLTPERLAAAEQRWEAAGIESYDVQVAVRGRQPAVYRVEVRRRAPQRAWRNDHPIDQHRVLGVWSVPGMFDTLARDLETRQNAEDPDSPTSRLDLSAKFNSEYGYPLKYRRLSWGEEGEVMFEVTEFTPLGNGA